MDQVQVDCECHIVNLAWVMGLTHPAIFWILYAPCLRHVPFLITILNPVIVFPHCMPIYFISVSPNHASDFPCPFHDPFIVLSNFKFYNTGLRAMSRDRVNDRTRIGSLIILLYNITGVLGSRSLFFFEMDFRSVAQGKFENLLFLFGQSFRVYYLKSVTKWQPREWSQVQK